MKSKYITPEITVVEFKVEAGFATSDPSRSFSLNIDQENGNYFSGGESANTGATLGGDDSYGNFFGDR